MIKPSQMPPHKAENPEPAPSKPSPKKPYVRPEHLTQRPLRNNPDLAKLRSQPTRKNQPNFKIRKK